VDLSKPVLGDPFNPMSGRYSDNVRRNSGKDSLDALRESMRRAGWLPYHPAIKDERGVVLVGHRRLSVAQELGIPVREGVEIQTIQFGRGDYADLRRSFLAFFSNEGGRPFAPEDRKDIARHLYLDNDLTEAQIADLLGVSQQTVARDLASTHVSTRRGGGRPRNVLDPVHASTLTPDQRQTVHRLGEEGKTIAVITKAVGTSEMPVRAEINRERGRRESTVTHVSDSLHGCLAPGCDHGKTDV
jgi:ParB-like chromosome segregation protein Spo0J